MSKAKILSLLITFLCTSILSCDRCSERVSTEPLNILFAIHGRDGAPENFIEMNEIFSRKCSELAPDKRKLFLENNGLILLGGRTERTRDLSIKEQVVAAEKEIFDILSRFLPEFKQRPKRIFLLGHSQGGVISEEILKKWQSQPEILKKHNILTNEFAIFTLGSPVCGIDGDPKKISELNEYLKGIFKEKMKNPSFLSEVGLEKSAGDMETELNKFFDEHFSPRELPSSSTDPGLKDLSRSKLRSSSPPSCKICYGVAESVGSNVLIKDLLAPYLFRWSSGSRTEGEYREKIMRLESKLHAAINDTERATIDRLWKETLDNEPHDGQVPVKSQYRPGFATKRYDMTHCELLTTPKVLDDVLEFFGMEVK